MVAGSVAEEAAGRDEEPAGEGTPASGRPVRGRRWVPPFDALYVAALAPGLLILLYWLIQYVGRAWSLVTFRYGYDYGEPPELDRAMAVAQGHGFYGFWNVPPYHMANYTPLYPLLNGLFVHLLGVQYTSGRAIAWVSSLLFCALLAWLAWREGRHTLAPLVTVLVWFSSHYVWNWTPLAREDDLALLLGTLGLVLVYEGVVRRGDQAAGTFVWPALVCFLAALYTRQTAVEALAATTIYLLATRPRLGLRFLVATAALAGVIFVGLDLATGGAFSYNVVAGNVNHFKWSRLHDLWHEGWTLYQGALLLAGLYVAMQLLLRRQQLFVLWLLAACAVAITAGKDGASDNYELLPWAGVSLAAGLAVVRLRDTSAWLLARRGATGPRYAAAAALPLAAGFLLLLQGQLSYHLAYTGTWPDSAFAIGTTGRLPTLMRNLTETGWYRRLIPAEPPPEELEQFYGYAYHNTPDARFADEQQAISQQVAATPGPVLDEDMTHLLLNGKPIFIQPFELSAEATEGIWDQAPFVRMLGDHRFGLIVLYHPVERATIWQRFTPQMQQAMEANYCQSTQTADYYLYRPCG